MDTGEGRLENHPQTIYNPKIKADKLREVGR